MLTRIEEKLFDNVRKLISIHHFYDDDEKRDMLLQPNSSDNMKGFHVSNIGQYFHGDDIRKDLRTNYDAYLKKFGERR